MEVVGSEVSGSNEVFGWIQILIGKSFQISKGIPNIAMNVAHLEKLMSLRILNWNKEFSWIRDGKSYPLMKENRKSPNGPIEAMFESAIEMTLTCSEDGQLSIAEGLNRLSFQVKAKETQEMGRK